MRRLLLPADESLSVSVSEMSASLLVASTITAGSRGGSGSGVLLRVGGVEDRPTGSRMSTSDSVRTMSGVVSSGLVGGGSLMDVMRAYLLRRRFWGNRCLQR